MSNAATASSHGPATVADATEHISTVMNHGWLCMLLAVGERLGLHEALATSDSATASEIAQRAACDQRYLEEWLWGMVAAGLVEASDSAEPTFTLRPEYVPVLTAAGGPLHWSRITTQITALATLEDRLVGAFQSGSGLGAEASGTIMRAGDVSGRAAGDRIRAGYCLGAPDAVAAWAFVNRPWEPKPSVVAVETVAKGPASSVLAMSAGSPIFWK